VPVWCVAPLEMNEGTAWGQGYNKSTWLQCRISPHNATFNLLTLPLGKTRYPLYRRLGGPKGRSGHMLKISSHRDPIPGLSSPWRVVIPTAISRPSICGQQGPENTIMKRIHFLKDIFRRKKLCTYGLLTNSLTCTVKCSRKICKFSVCQSALLRCRN
jgi:hypothetical protein